MILQPLYLKTPQKSLAITKEHHEEPYVNEVIVIKIDV